AAASSASRNFCSRVKKSRNSFLKGRKSQHCCFPLSRIAQVNRVRSAVHPKVTTMPSITDGSLTAKLAVHLLLLVLISMQCSCFHINEGAADKGEQNSDGIELDEGGVISIDDGLQDGLGNRLPIGQHPAKTKRFMYHSNGDCPVFRVQCFNSYDCYRQTGDYNYRCVMHRCAVSCFDMRPYMKSTK
ncbi:hypothetical protein BOX15_Mlig017203g2, partial [Macrostomum lignano]